MEKEQKDKKPQGFGNPAPAADRSERAGSQASTSNYCNVMEVGLLTSITDNAPRDRTDAEGSLSRSLSLPDLEDRNILLQERRAKRKRRGSTPELDVPAVGNKASNCLSFLADVTKQVIELEWRLREAYKPKKEICEISTNLAYLVDLAEKTDIRGWLEFSRDRDFQKEIAELRRENADLRLRLANAEAKAKPLLINPKASLGNVKALKTISSEAFTLVKNRRKKLPATRTEQVTPTQRQETAKVIRAKPQKKKHIRVRGEAIVIKPNEGQTFASVLKEAKKAVKPEDSGVSVRHVRQTRGGQVILEVQAKPEERACFSAALTSALVGKGVVKQLVQREKLVVHDLVETTDAEEVQVALKDFFAEEVVDANVNLTRRSVRGCIKAYVDLEARAAAKLERAGKLRVGWSICNVRSVTDIRCYRCLGSGHIAMDCKGEDRSKNCWQCGQEGHKAKGCLNPRQRRPPSTVKKKGVPLASSSPVVPK